MELTIRASTISGRGSFAPRGIWAGETIRHLTGEMISEEEMDQRIASGREGPDDPLQIFRGRFVDLDEPSRLINHSCDPNAALRGTNELFTLRDITMGEEVTYDYSTAESGFSNWVTRCTCGTSQCRRIIGNWRSLPPVRVATYYEGGGVAPFCEKRNR